MKTSDELSKYILENLEGSLKRATNIVTESESTNITDDAFELIITFNSPHPNRYELRRDKTLYTTFHSWDIDPNDFDPYEHHTTDRETFWKCVEMISKRRNELATTPLRGLVSEPAKMKLWLIDLTGEHQKSKEWFSGLWEAIVAAPSEDEARELVEKSEYVGWSNEGWYRNKEATTCTEISPTSIFTEPKIVLVHYTTE